MGKQHKNQSGPMIGIDITATHVRLLELGGKPGSIRATSYASEALPANAVSDHQIINVEAVSQAIARALKKSGSRNRNAAIGVSGAAVISKTIDMPADMDEQEIEQQIMFEAPQHIPYPIENVSLDFEVLGAAPDSPGNNQVLLVACRRDNVEMRTAVLEAARLKPRLVDVEEYALRNACGLLFKQMPNQGLDKTIGVFEIGSQQMRLNVLHNQRTVYSREVAFGCHELTAELVDQQGLDNVDQLLMHVRDSQLQAASIAPALDAFCAQAAQQIQSMLQYYFSIEATSDAIDQILLIGTCTQYPGFEQHIQHHLQWPTVRADPLRGVDCSGNARRNHIEHDGPSLMVAAGLSMRSIM